MSQEADPAEITGDGVNPVIPDDAAAELDPGPNTRRQLRLAGRAVEDDIPLPDRRRRIAGQRPQSLPAVRELPSETSEGDLPVFSPTTPGLQWDEDPTLAQLNSTLSEEPTAAPPTAGPSTGRSDRSFNFSGISQLSNISLSKEGLWLTRNQCRTSNISSVDSFQAAINAANLETSLLSTDDESDFQEAISQPLPRDKSDSPPEPEARVTEPSDQTSQDIGLAPQPSEPSEPEDSSSDIEGESSDPDDPTWEPRKRRSEPSEPSEPSDSMEQSPGTLEPPGPVEQPPGPVEQPPGPVEQPPGPADQPLEPSEPSEDESADNPIVRDENKHIMEELRAARNTILEAKDVLEEDIQTLRLDRVEYSCLKKRVDEAEDMKKRMRTTMMHLSTHDGEAYRKGAEPQAASIRLQIVDFITKGQERLAELAVVQATAPRNFAENAQAAARVIKANSVSEYQPKVMIKMEALKIKFAAMLLTVTPNLDESEFRKEEETERALTKQMDALTRDATKLRSDAVDAGMADEAATLEKTVRELQGKHAEVANAVLQQRLSRNLVTASPTSRTRSSDISPPTFSGEANSDYFKFVKELDEYVKVKCPSNEELVRILLTKCLVAEAKVACENMRTKEEIMTYIENTYGNVQILIQQQIGEVRKLGSCAGDDTKIRSWIIAARSKLLYVQSLAEEHDLESTLYHSNISAEVQFKLPVKIQDDFLLTIEKLDEGKQPTAEAYFKQLLKYLETLEGRYTYRLKLGVSLQDQSVKSSTAVSRVRDQKPQKPAAKRSYNVQDGYQQDGRQQKQRGAQRGRNFTNSSYEAKCAHCKKKHTHLYFCEVFQQAAVEDRYKLTWQAGVCFRCMVMNSCVDFNDRKAWFQDHQKDCKTSFYCKLDKCGDKPKSKQRSFLLCVYHKDKNSDMEKNFMDSLQGKLANTVKFFFFNPCMMNWQYNYGKARDRDGWDTIVDQTEPTIFMLNYVLIDDIKFLLFFDSGCATASISQRAKQLLCTETVRPGPTDISVASGKVLRIPGGEERFGIPLSDGNRRATITALCMPEVTTEFPVWTLKDAAGELNAHYQQFYPGQLLPKAPEQIGGCQVDIMIGIRYLRFFPQFRFMMDCGLSMYQSCFLSSDGEDGVLAGPHKSWRHIGETSHLVNRVYSSVSILSPRVEHETNAPDQLLSVEVHGDVAGNEGMVLEPFNHVSCEGQHCPAHQEDVYDIPPTWDITGSNYSTFSKDRLVKFLDGEDMGTSVAYRCPSCRNCSSCRSGENLEEVSLIEDREQYIIEKSIKYDPGKKQLIAKLPFIQNPLDKLTENLHIAKRVFSTQLKKASSDENVRLGIVAAHKKLFDRNFICKLDDLPRAVKKEVEGLVGYTIPWRTVVKENSISTPVRLVFDASSGTPGGESLNTILAKGSNTLGNLLAILIRFRLKKCAFTADVSMAYNGVRLDEAHLCYQKFLWKNEMRELSPLEIWIILTLIYGVKSSGNQTIEGFQVLGDVVLADPELHQACLGAAVLQDSAYMDDLASPHDDAEEAATAAEQLRYVLGLGSMNVKDITFSGTVPSELVSTDGKNVGLLGMLWNSYEDTISVNIGDLYLGKKHRGKSPEKIEDDLEDKLSKQFTRRVIVGKVASVYDPLGLLTPITARYKLQLHDICKRKLDWDDDIPKELLKTWCDNITEMQTLGRINFNRSIVPPDAANLRISYVISSDASEEIAICSVHSRMLRTNGEYHVQLVAAKSKIVTNLTVPRAELKGMVIGATLGFCILRNTKDRVDQVVNVTDSTICLHWLQQDQRPLQTGVRNAVLEIRRLTSLDRWFHIPSADNVADIGTRRNIPPDVSPESEWVSGKSWMKGPTAQMPLKTLSDIALNSEQKKLAAEETKNKDISGIVLHNLKSKVSERLSYSKYHTDPTRFPWNGPVRVMAVAFRFVDTLMKKVLKRTWQAPWFPEPTPTCQTEEDFFEIHRDSKKPVFIFNDFEISRARNYFFYVATKEVKQFTKKSEWKHCTEGKDKILYFNSRIVEGQVVENALGEGLDVSPLMFVKPVVDRYSPLAYALMTHAHACLARHRNVAETVRESRNIAYIFSARDLAIEIREACPFCRRYKARLIQREMGKLHDNRFVIAPPFYGVQCDMFGPLTAICEHNHRSTVKVWGLVFKDPSCGAIAVYCMAKYDTAAFVMAYTRHATRYGHPKRVVIDAGSQLVKAVNEMKTSLLELEGLVKIQHQVGIEFRVVPVGSHYQNGQVERGIKEVRNLFSQVYSGLRLDILAYETAFAWCSNELNSFPLCIGSRTDQLDNLDLITPSRLMYGRNNRRVMSGHATIEMPSKVLDQMEDTTRAWWKVWESQKIQDYISQPKKWLESGGTVNTGDIVVFLRGKKELAIGEPVWRIGRVVELRQGKDGQCRELVIEYRNADEVVFRQVTLDSRQVAILHHEGELELVDILNEASKDATVLYHLTVGLNGSPQGCGIQIPVKNGGLENPPVICNEVEEGAGNLESCTPAATEKKLKVRYPNPTTSTT